MEDKNLCVFIHQGLLTLHLWDPLYFFIYFYGSSIEVNWAENTSKGRNSFLRCATSHREVLLYESSWKMILFRTSLLLFVFLHLSTNKRIVKGDTPLRFSSCEADEKRGNLVYCTGECDCTVRMERREGWSWKVFVCTLLCVWQQKRGCPSPAFLIAF